MSEFRRYASHRQTVKIVDTDTLCLQDLRDLIARTADFDADSYVRVLGVADDGYAKSEGEFFAGLLVEQITPGEQESYERTDVRRWEQ